MAKSNPSNHNFMKIFTAVNFIGLLLLSFVVYALSQGLKAEQNTSNLTAVTSISYTCDNDLTLQAMLFEDKAEIMLDDGSSLLLMQAMSGSGVRYTNSDETVTFWTKGNTAFLEESSTTPYNNCTETTTTN